jgi:hypothetical protein
MKECADLFTAALHLFVGAGREPSPKKVILAVSVVACLLGSPGRRNEREVQGSADVTGIRGDWLTGLAIAAVITISWSLFLRA